MNRQMLTALDPALDGLEPDQPLLEAARFVLDVRLRLVGKLLQAARKAGPGEVEPVHQLRVATRRADTALRVLAGSADSDRLAAMRRRLKRIRRAADAARQADVHGAVLAEAESSVPEDQRLVLSALGRTIARSRVKAMKQVRAVAKRYPPRRFGRAVDRLLRSLRDAPAAETGGAPAAPITLRAAAAAALPTLVAEVRQAAQVDLKVMENLHRLRLRGKRLRYALEIFAACISPAARTTLYPTMKRLQDQLGQINDSHEIVLRLETHLRALRDRAAARQRSTDRSSGSGRAEALTALVRRFRRQRQRRVREFLDWCRTPEAEALLVDLSRIAPGPVAPSGAPAASPAAPPAPAEGPGIPYHAPVPRVAALDVGTNSIRLVVAEAGPDREYRIIDDEKETTRLGRGLYATGRMTVDAMKRSVRVIARMKRTAESYHVQTLRAVGTSAVREALNGDEFIALVKHRTGVALEMISAEHEARLAFASVQAAFDLSDLDVAVADLGGGSTEVVLASAGVIDEIRTLPLGAVRLSDMFGAGSDGGDAFDAMRECVEQTIAATLRKPPRPVELMIGTGGTFTTLAKIALRRGIEHAADRLPFDLRGAELTRSDVAALVDRLRAMPLRERTRVPGISAARAEIIVEGLTIVECLMARLGVERLRVHDGGIRDGLLMQMIEEHGLVGAHAGDAASDRLAQVRQFAESCRYDRHHAIQVARLALRLFDQLAVQAPQAGGWSSPENRELLHLAALLHDVGCMIEYRRHHKHSYRMIVEADLPSLTRREQEIIANIARYHRRRGPSPRHAGMSRLSDPDQRTVAHLAAILRIADGLDRTHAQEVRGVTVRVEDGTARISADAAEIPQVGLAAAMKKSDVFEDVFRLTPHLRWAPLESRTSRTMGAKR